jgi:maltose O-acetyltransferase
MPTAKELMLAGELYIASDPELAAERERCQAALAEANRFPADEERRMALLCAVLGAVGERTSVQAPFRCDYGYNVRLGAGVFVNYDAVFLDCREIVVGDRTQIGPGVQLLAADHPTDPALRREGWELAAPVVLGANVWLGGGVIVCPGVTVGDDTVIGAGSVVTRDLPAGVVAVGSPARVLRSV